MRLGLFKPEDQHKDRNNHRPTSQAHQAAEESDEDTEREKEKRMGGHGWWLRVASW